MNRMLGGGEDSRLAVEIRGYELTDADEHPHPDLMDAARQAGEHALGHGRQQHALHDGRQGVVEAAHDRCLVRLAHRNQLRHARRHALAVSKGCQQPVYDLLICIRRRIADERLHFRQCWRQTSEVECHAANQRAAIGLGGGFQPLARQPLAHERIDSARNLAPLRR